MEGVIKDTLAGQLSGVLKDLIVTAYDIERRTPYLFKSWKARGLELKPTETGRGYDFKLEDIARATSAAPTYFSPAKIKSTSGVEFAMVDGGVFANNPAMAAYVAARRIYPKADEYLVVSIGTGSLVHP